MGGWVGGWVVPEEEGRELIVSILASSQGLFFLLLFSLSG